MGDGDASGSEDELQTGCAFPCACVQCLCSAHCLHSPDHGGSVCFPPCSASSLVSTRPQIWAGLIIRNGLWDKSLQSVILFNILILNILLHLKLK